MSEYWDVYDKFRNRTNKTIQRDSDERLKNGEYHIVVTGIVENSNKQILITRRNTKSYIQDYGNAQEALQKQEKVP